jgi:hypothetical protein
MYTHFVLRASKKKKLFINDFGNNNGKTEYIMKGGES